jgi:hypothetical protein
MKVDFKIILLILFSCTLGLFIFRGIFPTITVEAMMLSGIMNSRNSVLNQINILLLILSHLSVMSLLFLKSFKFYKYFLIIFPLVFLLFYCTNMVFLLFTAPALFLFFIPYLVTWLIAVNDSSNPTV